MTALEKNRLTEVVKITRRSTDGESAANTDPETCKSKTHDYPPHPDKRLRNLEQEAVEYQKCCFNGPQHQEH